ncbi:MAG TPA: cytochrome c maturation protein CcmE [Sedimenticola sp.]|nr:cytochrome c maturation protein CcmE [Sedimenticola sp.]
MKPRHKRLIFVAVAVVALGVAATLIITGLRSNVSYFFSPTEVLAGKHPKDAVFRIGGLVKEGSLKRIGKSLTVQFIVTDNAADVTTQYTGILPDLFQEGQGVVAKGRIGEDGIFQAEEVLAKHDEKYMPPEAQAALDEAAEAKKNKQQENLQ